MKMFSGVVVLMTLILSGCVSPEQQTAMDRSQCSSFGFTPGTDAFAACMQKTSIHRDDVNMANRDYYSRTDAATQANNHKKNGFSASANVDATNLINGFGVLLSSANNK